MPIVHLIRHGATATSGSCYAGRADVALTAQGYAQAEALAQQLGDRPMAAIISSPLRRAVDTAKPLAHLTGLAITRDLDLMELDFGALEGCPKSDVTLNLRKTHLVDPVPGGESLGDLWVRTARVARRLRRFPQDAEVVAVGHHWSNRLLFGHLRCRSLDDAAQSRQYRPSPGSLLTFHTTETLDE